MAVLQMEVVVGSIKVGRHHSNVVRSVLNVEAFAHLQPGNFGDGVRLVGVFQGARQQTVLRHRLRSLPRIDASAAEEEQLLHAVFPAFAYDVLLNLQVLEDEVRPVLQVSHNPSDMSGSQYHGIRLFLVEEILHLDRVQQVEFPMTSPDKVVIPSCLQVVPNGRANQTMMPCNVDL